MLQKNKKHYCTRILIIAVVLVEIFKLFPAAVETVYTNGFYRYYSLLLRTVFGWLPFSFGDLLYSITIVFALYKCIKGITKIIRAKFNLTVIKGYLLSGFKALLAVYLIFNISWAINYARNGSASQLEIYVDDYSVEDLKILTGVLNKKTEQTIAAMQPEDSTAWYRFNLLSDACFQSYTEVHKKYPFIKYQHLSVKPMLYGKAGAFGGFAGYYNPFTGEAQINYEMPGHSRSQVLCHEMAHQLGYAAEEEANMIGWLAGRESKNPAIRYSAYNDMLVYAIMDLRRKDTVAFKAVRDSLPDLVKKHFQQSKDYYAAFANSMQTHLDAAYDTFLKANGQEKGKKSYRFVIAWLIAYGKKYGWEAL